MKPIKFPKTLREAVRDGKVVPFVGPGPSIQSGLPGWDRIIRNAVERLTEEERYLDAEALTKYIDLQQNDFSEVLRAVKQKLGLLWNQFLLNSFSPTDENTMCNKLEVQRTIWKLSNGLVITINYDSLLEISSPSPKTLEIATIKTIEQYLSLRSNSSLSQKLWPLLGRIEEVRNLTFTADGFNPIFFDPAVFNYLHDCRFWMRQVANNHTIIFIGTTLPSTWHGWTNAVFKNSPRMHYWLTKRNQHHDLQNRFDEQDLPIQIISFDSHNEINNYLEELANLRTDGVTKTQEGKEVAKVFKEFDDQALLSLPNKLIAESERSLLITNTPIELTKKISPNPAPSFDVAIVCALHDPELTKVLKTGEHLWEELPATKHDPTTYYKTKFITKQNNTINILAAAPTQMGMPAAAVLTTKIILRFRPKLVAMVGIAAGIKKESQNFGDILAADNTFDAGSGKIASLDGRPRFMPDQNQIHILPRLRDRLKHWSKDRTNLDSIYAKWQADPPTTVLKLHVGPIASVAAVIDHHEPIADILEHCRKLIGIEMEAYAVSCACRDTVHPSPAFLCIKSICDFATSKHDGWQRYAAFTAAEFVYRFLIAEWEDLNLDSSQIVG